MKSKSDAENHKKSRLIAEKVYLYCRDESRQMSNIAICRGKRQLSRFRTHRDKLLPLVVAVSLDMYLLMKSWPLAISNQTILPSSMGEELLPYMMVR